jgi:hypothetical protein
MATPPGLVGQRRCHTGASAAAEDPSWNFRVLEPLAYEWFLLI